MPTEEPPQQRGRRLGNLLLAWGRRMVEREDEERGLEALRLEAGALRLRQAEAAGREARDRRLAEEYRATRGRRGRPKGSGMRFTREQLLTADRKLKQDLGRPPTQEELAEELTTEVRTLQERLRTEQIPWPIPD